MSARPSHGAAGEDAVVATDGPGCETMGFGRDGIGAQVLIAEESSLGGDAKVALP